MNNTVKYAIVTIIILIPLSLGFNYIFSSKTSNNKPYEVLAPEVYEKGTKVSLYKETPPNFPKEVILENKIPDYSGVVTAPEGATQTTVSYITDKSMEEVVDIYDRSLPLVGWKIVEKTVYTKVAIISFKKEKQSIFMSIAPLKEGDTLVTFQYEE